MAENLTAKQQRFVDEYLIDAERFWAKVQRSRSDTGCWNYLGAKDQEGYGRFHIGLSRNSTMLAHRVAFGLLNGYLPEAVCHHCDNPSCCNPNHLFPGDRAMNNRDMAEKGRNRVPRIAARGEAHHSAKLTNEDVAKIRVTYSGGGVTQRSLAFLYGVSQRTIAKAVSIESFKNV